MSSLIWKFILMSVLSALAGSAITVTIINTSAPEPIECPKIEETSGRDAETFWVTPGKAGRDKGF